mgnify:CR=1 FL=1
MDIMTSYLPIIIGLLGCIVGSFLNVVALRQETGKDLGGRSHCPSCNHQLTWYELIPVVSFLIQLGRCRNCKKTISPRYVSVELFVGVLYFLTTSFITKAYFGVYTSLPGWFFVWLLSLLIIVSYGALIVIYDIQTKTVPLVWFIGLVFFSCIYLVIPYISGAASALSVWRTIGFVISGMLIALPFLAMWLVSKGRWMGFADIEIIAWIGMFFGVQMGASAVLLSFYLGSFFGIVFIIYKFIKGIPYTTIRKIQIPFAPFLFLGWFITLLYSFNIFTLLSGLFI